MYNCVIVLSDLVCAQSQHGQRRPPLRAQCGDLFECLRGLVILIPVVLLCRQIPPAFVPFRLQRHRLLIVFDGFVQIASLTSLFGLRGNLVERGRRGRLSGGRPVGLGSLSKDCCNWQHQQQADQERSKTAFDLFHTGSRMNTRSLAARGTDLIWEWCAFADNANAMISEFEMRARQINLRHVASGAIVFADLAGAGGSILVY